MRETELGKVYHGRHLLMDKPVAVKILAPAFAVDEAIVRRFSSEAKRISHISHPNILNVTDFGSDAEGAVYIVFEDAEGETLKSVIDRQGMFPPDHAVQIAKQVASALSAAHVKGVVHGNLNSENILVGDDDTVKVLDLGAVKLDAVAVADDELAFPKIEYLSPEQCADEGDADERSDIYSLGVVLYEMLAGEPPFKAGSTSELMMKHAQEPPPPLAAFRQDLPPAIEPLILQTLAKNPEMRHQTAAELFDDLNRVERTIAVPETAAKAAPANNNIWKTAFVVLAGISLLSVTLIWATSSKQTNPSTLQADSNSQPVQPINPATGSSEQGLATIVPMSQVMLSNSNMTLEMPQNLGGSDGNPYWQNGTVPPGGPVIPGGGQVIDPNNPNSPFNQDEPASSNNIICDENGKCWYIVPNTTPNPNANANVKTTPRTTKSPASNVIDPTVVPNNTPPPQTTPTPDAKPTPAKSPAGKPTPKTTPTKQAQSGKTQDSD